MSPISYILDKEGNPRPEPNLKSWSEWCTQADRVVERTFVGNNVVSTVFLACDYSVDGGEPVLWETMIFGEKYDGKTERYTSIEDAREGHRRMVGIVKRGNKKEKKEV